jgi:hypothetical protein
MMSVPWLYDAVTLRHFGTIGRLDVLVARCRRIDPPRWTQEVADEIARAADKGRTGCRDILAATWLAAPIEPEIPDLKGIYALQVGLNEGRQPPKGHGGEAEGIYFARKLGGHFVTDDNGAYDFAARRLGAGRVHDTVDLLSEAVAYGDLDGSEALHVVNVIRDNDRHLRRVHPRSLVRSYFER